MSISICINDSWLIVGVDTVFSVNFPFTGIKPEYTIKVSVPLKNNYKGNAVSFPIGMFLTFIPHGSVEK